MGGWIRLRQLQSASCQSLGGAQGRCSERGNGGLEFGQRAVCGVEVAGRHGDVHEHR
jgi:hypothetical protein